MSLRRLAWAGLAAALVCAAGLRVGLIAHRYFDTDELVHLHAALLVAHGNLPFRDFFEHHGPLFSAMLAPVISRSADPLSMALRGRALVSLCWAGILLLVAKRRGVGAFEGALAAAWLAFFTGFLQKSLEIRPDVPAAVLILAACAAAARSERWSGLAVGAALGLAGWCTPKAIFPAAGLVLASAWRRREKKRAATDFILLSTLGAALMVGAGVAYFAARGALGALWTYYVLYNAGFPGADVAWSMTLKPSLLSDPLIWVLGLTGLRRWRQRPEESGALVVSLAGLAITPSAYPQYLLIVAPFVAWFASAELLGWVGFSRRRGMYAAAALALSFALPARAALKMIGEGNELQRERWTCVSSLIPADAAVWDAWTGDSFHRPHAARIWFVPDDSQAYYDPLLLEHGMIGALANARTRGAIRCESCLARLPRNVTVAFNRHFRPSGCGRLWVRKQ
jgi:hypothetical protein